MPRIAKSLDALRAQVNQRWPERNKASDGWLGDTAHAARASDHNPNNAGVVQALDLTHDPEKGPDAGKLADAIRLSKDPRIKYIISNRRIASSYATGGVAAWMWRPYSGSNAHTKHCHVSVSDQPKLYDDPRFWTLDGIAIAEPPPSLPDFTLQRKEMGKLIIGYEYSGDLKVHTASDGSKEIAGVNETHHPDKYKRLKSLLDSGHQVLARQEAAQYAVEYSDLAVDWTDNGASEFYLRDTIFHRGPTGAARILQRAVGVAVDGVVGTQTKAAVRQLAVDDLLQRLRVARESYEREKYRRGPGDALWQGLVNRWNKTLADAQRFKGMNTGPAVIGTIILGGGAAGVAAASGMDWASVAMLIGGVLLLAAVVFFLIRKRQNRT